MNYGYAPSPQDRRLAMALRQMVSQLPPPRWGRHPSVQVDGIYAGVRIRNLTHYSEEMLDRIIRWADGLHKSIVV